MEKTALKCPECPYDKSRNLGTHLFFVHGYSKKRISEWRMNEKAAALSSSRHLYDIFRCQFCPKTYRRQNSCRAHERVVHCVSFSTRQKCVPCPIRNCSFTTTALLDLCAHAKESHSQLGDFTIREARFENMSLFQAWRLQYEEDTATVLATESVNSNAAAGTTLRYLRCAQLEAQIRKVRSLKRQSEGRGNGRRRASEVTRDENEDEDRRGEEEEEEGYGSLRVGNQKMKKAVKEDLLRAVVRREEEEEEERGEQEGEDGVGEEEEDEEEAVGRDGSRKQETVAVSGPRRSPRKRKMEGAEEEYGSRPEQEEGYGSIRGGNQKKMMKEVKEEREEEEEEIDVEQLDDVRDEEGEGSEEAGPSTAAAAVSAATAAKKSSLRPPPPPATQKRHYEEPEDDEERAPRLLRASSAHLADAEVVDRDENCEREMEPVPMSLYEQERRMNSRHCTAHMRVLILRTGAVHVEYCSTHLGHEVIPLPPSARVSSSERRVRDVLVKPSAAIAQEIEADIEEAKKRRKGRRQTENRWRKESRMRQERAQFSQLLEAYEDIGANVELYEAEDDEEDLYEEEVDDMGQMEGEVIEEEVVVGHGVEEEEEELVEEDSN